MINALPSIIISNKYAIPLLAVFREYMGKGFIINNFLSLPITYLNFPKKPKRLPLRETMIHHPFEMTTELRPS